MTNSVRERQSLNIVKELNKYFNKNPYKYTLARTGISKYVGLKSFILANLGFSYDWIDNNPEAYSYPITVQILDILSEDAFYETYEYFSQVRYSPYGSCLQ